MIFEVLLLPACLFGRKSLPLFLLSPNQISCFLVLYFTVLFQCKGRPSNTFKLVSGFQNKLLSMVLESGVARHADEIDDLIFLAITVELWRRETGISS